MLILSIGTIPFLQGTWNGHLARLGRRIRILLVRCCSTAHVSCDASVSLFEKIRLCPVCCFLVETRCEMSQLLYFIYSTFGNGVFWERDSDVLVRGNGGGRGLYVPCFMSHPSH